MRTWWYAALLAALAGCKKHAPTPAAVGAAGSAQLPVVMVDAPKEVSSDAVAKRYGECLGFSNAKDWTSLATCYASKSLSDYVDSGLPAATSWDAVAARDKLFTDAFPDLQASLELTLANGRNAAAFALVTGTDSAPLKLPSGDVPATHKKIGVQVAHVVHFTEDGKAYDREWLYQDFGELLGQLGLTKTPVRLAAAKPWQDSQLVIAKDDPTEKKNLVTVNHVMTAINDHEPELLDETLDDKVVWSEQALAKDWTGKADVIKEYAGLIKAFSDLEMSTDTAWAAGDYVVVQGTWSGTNDGADPAIGIAKPTKQHVVVKFARLFEIKADKVTRTWGFWNRLALDDQLGLPKPLKK